MSIGKVKKIQRKDLTGCWAKQSAARELAAARKEHEQLFDLLKRSQAAAREEIFFSLGCWVPLGVNTNNCSACVPGSQAQPESDPGAAGCSQRLYVYIGYAARYPEQSRTIVRLNPESRIPIPMTTRTIHRFIFSAARCAPNLPQQRPDNPNNLSGYAQGLRFSQRESPR